MRKVLFFPPSLQGIETILLNFFAVGIEIDSDLKLENVLLDKDGHVKITDFGLSKEYEDEDSLRTKTVCGTLEYLAPEAILQQGYSFSVDWWAFGVVLFEMMCGWHPFYTEDRQELYNNILYAEISYPSYLSATARDLLSRLLERDPRKRLGCGRDAGREVQMHPFYAPIDFTKLFNRQIEPPFKPQIMDDSDVRFFDEEFTDQEPRLSPPTQRSHLNKGIPDSAFAGYTYVEHDLIQ
jgi:RAC serine/threonine-protein kinase